MLISKYIKNYLIKLNRKHIAWGHLTELDEIFDAFYKRERLIDVHPKNRHKRILDRLDRENYKNGVQKENAIFTKKLSQIGEDGKLARMFILKDTEKKKCRFCNTELKHNGWACNQSPCEICDEYCCSCFCGECGLKPCQCDYIEYLEKQGKFKEFKSE